ncbi:Nucleotidyltransferase [Rhizopus microsporus]|uniref:polynucleotide adenylyltransferase n=1 Tax=Rhizopus microsporus TaxID=58291 RepID=A0A1X0RPF2_RHIZD|nr:Nucleotidyltransferase [Rhizopus microsporus]
MVVDLYIRSNNREIISFIDRSPSPNAIEEDFIPIPKVSRQQRRYQERQELKEKREPEDESDIDVYDTQYDYLYPWMHCADPFTHQDKVSVAQYQKEVERFVDYIAPKENEIALREFLVTRIRNAIHKRWPDAGVDVFGSFATGVYLFSGDIDISIGCSPPTPRFTLRAVASTLREANICDDYTLIAKAKASLFSVPVLKFEDKLSNIKVDIVMNSDNGVRSASIRHPKVATRQIDPMKNLAPLFSDFLQLYGSKFNIDDVGIDVQGEGEYFRKVREREREKEDNWKTYTIIDPQDSSNDLGVKSFKSKTVAKNFHYGYVSIYRKACRLNARLKQHNYNYASAFSNYSLYSKSLLAACMYIHPETVQHREHMRRVYDDLITLSE